LFYNRTLCDSEFICICIMKDLCVIEICVVDICLCIFSELCVLFVRCCVCMYLYIYKRILLLCNLGVILRSIHQIFASYDEMNKIALYELVQYVKAVWEKLSLRLSKKRWLCHLGIFCKNGMMLYISMTSYTKSV